MTARQAAGLALGLMLMTGCATKWNYSKPDVDQVQMERDREACADEARTPFGSHPIELAGGRIWSFPFQTVSPKALNACMVGKGYVLDP